LRADKDTGAFSALGAAEKIDHAALGFEIVEQQSHPFEVLDCLEIVEQVSRATHNQLTLIGFSPRPAREAGGDDLLREQVEFGLGSRVRFLQFGLGLDQRAAAHMSIEKVCSL